nr:hypothetical protein Q903MT_gene2291 [Picea sitchensis]
MRKTSSYINRNKKKNLDLALTHGRMKLYRGTGLSSFYWLGLGLFSIRPSFILLFSEGCFLQFRLSITPPGLTIPRSSCLPSFLSFRKQFQLFRLPLSLGPSIPPIQLSWTLRHHELAMVITSPPSLPSPTRSNTTYARHGAPAKGTIVGQERKLGSDEGNNPDEELPG